MGIRADECSFAHGVAELRVVTLEERESLGLLPSAATFKTAICWNWLITGGVPFSVPGRGGGVGAVV